MEFLIKFAQAHETFRVPEIEALALVEGLEMKIVDYSQDVRYPSHQYMLVRDLLKKNSPPFVSYSWLRSKPPNA